MTCRNKIHYEIEEIKLESSPATMESNEACTKYYATEDAVASLEAAYESVEVVKYAPNNLLFYPLTRSVPRAHAETTRPAAHTYVRVSFCADVASRFDGVKR